MHRSVDLRDALWGSVGFGTVEKQLRDLKISPRICGMRSASCDVDLIMWHSRQYLKPDVVHKFRNRVVKVLQASDEFEVPKTILDGGTSYERSSKTIPDTGDRK